jgi:spore maturation protein CgeB
VQESLLKKHLGYAKFSSDPRVLILDTGYLVVRDLLDACEDLGWQVTRVPAPQKGQSSGDFVGRLLEAVARHKPDYVLTINHLGFDVEGALAQLLDRFDICVASWFVDHPTLVLGSAEGIATDSCQIFSFERTALPWLEGKGFKDPAYLPTASNGRYFRRGTVDESLAMKLATKLSFVGNSWWTKSRLEPTAQIRKAARALSRRKTITKEFFGGGLEERLHQIKAPTAAIRFDIAKAAVAEASMQRRRRFAEALHPEGLRIHGDPHWREFVSDLDLGGTLDSKTELPALFAGSEINTNVTAEQMPTAVNQRVWDVPAVGGFLITDAQDDLLEFFTDEEDVVAYRSFEEAADKVRFYADKPELRRSIAARAEEKIGKEHRFTHRMLAVYEVMKRRFG